MLSVASRVRVVAFAIIAIVVVAFIGNNYADLGRYVGLRDYYTVGLRLPSTGGLFQGSAVSYRGVTVGKVGKLDLVPNGVVAELRIKKSAPDIPRDLQAIVANRSAVGEQYVDLRPKAASGPYLAQGATIAQSATSVPPPVTETLVKVNDLAASVPLQDLQTVIDELGDAFAGQGPHLQQLLDTGGRFIDASDANFPTTSALIDNGRAVLRTQNEESASFRSFARDAALLTRALRGADGDLRRLIKVTPPAVTAFVDLLHRLDPQASVLVANLLTTARITAPRLAGLEELFAKLPQLAALGNTIVAGGKANFGLINTFFNPQPCTRGYGATPYRGGTNLAPAPPLNTGARCTEPASSGINVRGAAHAPRRGVPGAVRPGAFAAQSEVLGALGLPSLNGAGPSDLPSLLGLPGGNP